MDWEELQQMTPEERLRWKTENFARNYGNARLVPRKVGRFSEQHTYQQRRTFMEWMVFVWIMVIALAVAVWMIEHDDGAMKRRENPVKVETSTTFVVPSS